MIATVTTTARATTTARPILVVDDDAKIVRLVKTYLEREGFRVATAGDGPAALEAIEAQRPALVVLDLMLPELDGRAVLRAVRRDEEAGTTPVLILSARGTTIDRISGLEDGADDYLPKPFSPAELVVRVKAILRRSAGATPATAAGGAGPSGGARAEGSPHGPIRHNGLVLDPARHEVAIDTRPVQLTHVEFRLLQTLLEADGRVLTRDQLLDAVWGADQADVLDRTIDVHIRRLRDKLGDDPDAPRWVATVRGSGYRAAPKKG
jgi:DNA-binding response OmpR family regulator